MKNILQPEVETAIRARIAALSPQDPARWGKMNIGQMLCHCADQFRMISGEIPCKPFGGWFYRNVLKWLVLYVIRAPKGRTPTAPEIDQAKQGGTPPQTFDNDRNTLLALLDRFLQNPDAPTQAHPAFGYFSRWQWGRMIYLHLDHHLEQFGV